MTTWRQALTSIPRVDESGWQRMGLVTRWLVASRAAVLVMTAISSIIAGILAWRAGIFDWLIFGVMTSGLLAAHAANNLLNDLTDHRTGSDRDDSFRTRYGTQPLESGLMTVRQNLVYFALTGAVGLAAGLYLTWRRGPEVLGLIALGGFFLLAYTWPLKHIGLGEVSALVVWGPLMIGGGFFTLTGTWSWWAVVAGLPYALGVTSVLFAKHIDKHDNDRRRGIHTFPVLVGIPAARSLVLAAVAAQYLIVAGLVIIGSFQWPILAVLAAAPLLRYLIPVFTNDPPQEPPPEYPASAWPLWYVSFAFVHNRRFGAVYVSGLLVEAMLVRGVA